MTSMISLALWELLLKPGHLAKRAETFYHYPFEQIAVMTALFLICAYPIIVIFSLFSISKKITIIEKNINKGD